MHSPTAETPLFDPDAIDKLRSVAGDNASTFVAEMAQLFLDETLESLERLQAATTQEDWKQVTRIAHSLKSSAATLGLMRLSGACRALELDTRLACSSPQTTALIAAVLDEFELTRPTLTTLS
jgi:HPt (histidine-containing phosphotransfer) domain-containing protein